METIIFRKRARHYFEALPYYSTAFAARLFVVEVWGKLQWDSPDERGTAPCGPVTFVFLEAVGINPVVVHGGGKARSLAALENRWF